MKIRVLTIFAAAIVMLQLTNIQPAMGMKKSQETANRKIDRAIKLEVIVNAPVANVWQAWTTRDGIKSFFAADGDIDLRVLGKYDILFSPTAPPGLRGAEGNLILAIQEEKMFSFTWDAPPAFPDIRRQRTSVVVRFAAIEANKTRVLLIQTGWGEGDEWNKAYDYFVRAWGNAVLPFLRHSLEVGPIDWKNPPRNLEQAKLLAD